MTKQESTKPPNDDDVGEFAAFHGRNDMLAAYLYAKDGEAMLREVFKTDTFARERLQDYAEELESRGLDQVAAILRDIAKRCPSGIDLDNPYEPNDGTYNWSEWRRMWLLRRGERTGELSAFLRRHHVQRQRQMQALQAKASQTRH